MLQVTYLPNGNIQLQSPEISAMVANMSNYNRVKVAAKVNCCPQTYVQELALPLVDTTMIAIVGSTIEVKPIFFAFTSTDGVIDGVYTFEVKLFLNNNTFIYQENCSFIDINYRCLVANSLKDLLSKSEDGMCATNIHVLHYALINGSNCGCNCDEMCKVFNQLKKLIGPITLQTTGCGC